MCGVGRVWKIWWKEAYKECFVEVVGSSMKIDETWSAVGLKVEAFSMAVEAFSQ